MRNKYWLQLIKQEYAVRWGALTLAAVLIILGAIMVFEGLPTISEWRFHATPAVQADLKNATPGIVFTTAGVLLAVLVMLRPAPKFTADTNNVKAVAHHYGGRLLQPKNRQG